MKSALLLGTQTHKVKWISNQVSESTSHFLKVSGFPYNMYITKNPLQNCCCLHNTDTIDCVLRTLNRSWTVGIFNTENSYRKVLTIWYDAILQPPDIILNHNSLSKCDSAVHMHRKAGLPLLTLT